ncbi:N-terminal domain of galactosyltransferase [Chitinophaga sp. CF118]|uniref:glycosyltransferase family 2 protein n=1 Tax=Chitinophaga sp. CF118 TaxID=1884367 RepID=UPI0008E4DE50|nr:glycosyltransferase family 2 protein [Chitinophaga sp. CF118]SFF06862.1 N-terminal domain of galactosyltransferase [Chitinophaga sp. CF118]
MADNVITCSLVISTYNWSKALDFSLQCVLRQTVMPNEIVIADDGSTEETAELIERFKNISPIPIIHIWQEDKGFRKSKILNKAIMAASHKYIIQIDGDILIDPNFIKDHLWIAKENYYVRGSRALLDTTVTEFLLKDKIVPPVTILAKLSRHKLNALRNLTIARFLSDKYKVRGKERYNMNGCNMAFWKDDFIEINGYNEAFVGWGCEDVEFAMRLNKSGKTKQSLKMAGVAFHLSHPLNSRKNFNINNLILEQSIQHNYHKCLYGIYKLNA